MMQVSCNAQESPVAFPKLVVIDSLSGDSTLTADTCNGSSREVTVAYTSPLQSCRVTTNITSQQEYAVRGTLAQVVSKYVDPDHQCLLSTQVLYSEDSSLSAVSPSADTASSPNSITAKTYVVPSPSGPVLSRCSEAGESVTEPPAAAEVCSPLQPLWPTQQNPDNLESMLPSNMRMRATDSGVLSSSGNRQPRGGWSWSSTAPPLTYNQISQVNLIEADPAETWSNLCELPASWQFDQSEPTYLQVADHELVDVKPELQEQQRWIPDSYEALSNALHILQSSEDENENHHFSAVSVSQCLPDNTWESYICNDPCNPTANDSTMQITCSTNQSTTPYVYSDGHHHLSFLADHVMQEESVPILSYS